MRYETLRSSALSHRFISVAASAVMALVIVAAGVVTADPLRGETKSSDPYLFNYSVLKMKNDTLAIRGEIIDNKTKEVISQPTLMTRDTEATATEIVSRDRKWRIEITPDGSGGGAIAFTAWTGAEVAQRSSYTFGKPEAPARAPRFQGEPISLNLQNADIRDVINTFQQLTNLKISAEPDVKGTITVNVRDVPWDQAFDQVIRENGFDYTIASDGSLTVFIKK